MTDNTDRRTKDIVGSVVRYKSYGQFAKGKGSADSADEMLVRGFFTSDEMDEVGDIITRSATEEAVERWRKWGNIRTMHDNPSGRIEAIGEKDGLAWNEVVTVPVDPHTKELLKGGVLKAYSVGIIPRRYEINEAALEESTDPWFMPLIIHEYDMVEISYVDHPANYSATISDVSGGKAKGFDHRAVLFKNLEAGDSDMDSEGVLLDTDVEAADEAAIDVVESEHEEGVSESVDEAVDVEVKDVDGDSVEEADVDSDVEKSEGDDETVEKESEPEFDVAVAVRDIKGQVEGLSLQLAEFSEFVSGSLVEAMVERFVEAMSSADKGSAEVDSEPSDDEAHDKALDEDRIVEKVVKQLAEILVPQVTRTASVIAGNEDEDTPATAMDKTKEYIKMGPAERREKMRQVLSQMTNK